MAGKKWTRQDGWKDVLRKNPDGVGLLFRRGEWIAKQYGYPAPLMRSKDLSMLYIRLYKHYRKIMFFDKDDNIEHIDIKY